MKKDTLKKLISLILCLIMLAALTGCDNEEKMRQAIIGTWTFKADATKAIAEQVSGEMGIDADQIAEMIGEFLFQGSLELKEDGTYKLSLDKEDLKERVSQGLPKLKPVMREYMIKTMAKEFLEKEDATQEELEEVLGSSLDEFFSTFIGMSLDDFIDQTLSEMDLEDLLGTLEEAEQEGRYLVDAEKSILYFSDSLEKEPDKTVGEAFTMKDGVVEITEHIGKGLFEQLYPVTLTKNP